MPRPTVRPLRRLGAALALLAAAAPSLAAQGAEGPPAVVTGRVVDAATGEPVPGVFLHAFPGLHRAVTDGEGAFRMELPAGPYLVWHSALGYPDLAVRWAVAGDTALPALRVEALPPVPEGGDGLRAQVLGTIVDAGSGAPIRDARVAAQGGAVAITDERGGFVLARVEAGSRYVSFSRLGYASAGAMVEAQGRTQLGLIALREDAVALEALAVVVDRLEERRRASGWSARLLSGDEVRRATARSAYELVTDRTGISPTSCFQLLPGGGSAVEGGCFTVRGTPTAVEVFVDEVRLRDGLSGLKFFRAHEFERVEIFGGGRQVRLYTPTFLRWMAQTNFNPSALSAP